MWLDTESACKNNSFSLHHQKTHREGYHGHTSIHNSLKEKVSRNQPNKGNERPLQLKVYSSKERIRKSYQRMERCPNVHGLVELSDHFTKDDLEIQ